MYIEKNSNASFNFKAPTGAADNSVNEVNFPFHESISEPDLAEDVAITQQVTIIDLGTLTANKTVNLDVHAQVTPGAVIHMKYLSDTTARTVTPGTGFLAPAISGTISKTKAQSFIYNGSAFVAMGAVIQLD